MGDGNKGKKAHLLSGDAALKLTDKGRVKIKGDPWAMDYSDKTLKDMANSNAGSYAGEAAARIHSQRKLNDYLKETGYSLQGGKGMQVVGNYRLNMGDGIHYGTSGVDDSGEPGLGRQTVMLYGKASKNDGPDRSSGGGATPAPSAPPASITPSKPTEQSREIAQSGMFDVPAKGTSALSFAQQFMQERFGGGSSSSSSSDDGSGDDGFQPRPGAYGDERKYGLGRLSDGSPEDQDADPALQKTESDWASAVEAAAAANRGVTDDDDDDDEPRRFAGSDAFRSALLTSSLA